MTPARRKILVVEDDQALARALADFLSPEFDVVLAHTSREAWDQAALQRPDLMILDILIPQWDGMTTLRKMRGTAWGRNLPVIMLTNMEHPGWVTEAQELKVYDFFLKADVSLEQVVTAVRRALDSPQPTK